MVWSDQLGATREHLPGAMALMPDPRARHYWDGDRLLGRAYQRALSAGGRTFELDDEAWDVWLLFDRDVLWDDSEPPVPTWWEHQLGGAGLPADRVLDPERFALEADELLLSTRPEKGPGSNARPAEEQRGAVPAQRF